MSGRPPSRPRAALGALVALALAAAAPVDGAVAQDPTRPNVPNPAPADPVLGGARWVPSFGAHVGIPTVLAAHVGVARLQERRRGDEAGPYAGVEAGLGGFKGGVGMMARGDVGALTLQLAALRTTDRPWVAARRATYVGLDARAMVLLVTLGLGVYVRTDGGDAQRVIPAASLGISY